MNKSSLSLFLIAFVIVSLMSVATVNVGVAQTSGTNVSGVISSSTIWTQANSPYNFVGNVLVNSGDTLRIEPGTTINLGSYYMSVKGAVVARGTSENQIIFNGGQYIDFTQESIGWDESIGSGCLIENSIINSPLTISSPVKMNNDIIKGAITIKIILNGTPVISNSIIKGGISASVHTHANITNNTILNQGLSLGSTGNVANINITGNIISGCSSGITVARWVSSIFGNDPSFQTIEKNLIFNNTVGITINNNAYSTDTGPNIQNNTITGNNIGLSINGGSSKSLLAINERVLKNNIYSNINYNIKNQDLNNLNATYNWWGTSDIGVISQGIYDFKNDFTFGNVDFVPFLDSSNPNCPAYTPSGSTPTPAPSTSPSNNQTSTPTPIPTSNPPITNQTQISIIVDVSSTNVGASVHIKGKLLDANGNPLSNKQVTLSYALSNSSMLVPIGSGNTNVLGEYDIQWVNTASGTFTLETKWSGANYYLEATNTTTISFLPYDNQNALFVESNSTVTELAFNSTSSELSFTVDGTTGSMGYVKTTIAKSLIQNPENIKVYLDGNQLTYGITSNTNAWLLTFNYHHSTHQVKITLTADASEPFSQTFNYWILGAAVLAICLLLIVIVVAFRSRSKVLSDKND
jgi:hypothetical protein